MVDVHPIAGQLVVGRADDVVPAIVIGKRFWREPSPRRRWSG
jgi:hypothetical protein